MAKRKKLGKSPKLELKTRATSELEISVANDMDAPDKPIESVIGLSQNEITPEDKKAQEEAKIEAEMNSIDKEVD
jgi:hypothetical protein